MHKKRIKAEEYRRLACDASALARASELDNVREKHELAAAQWTSLAEHEERAPYRASASPALIAIGAAAIEALCSA